MATKKTTKAPAKRVSTKAAEKVIEKPARAKKAEKPKLKIPKTMGAVADLLYTTRASRLETNNVVKELQEQETQLKTYIIDNLPKSDQTGATGKLANVKVIKDEVFQAADWDEVYAWIKKTGNFQILNRALNQASIQDIYENSDKKFKGIPGIVRQGIVKVSVTKA